MFFRYRIRFKASTVGLVANPNALQHAVSSAVNDPLAPPHTTADIFFLIPGISWANILLSEGRSEAPTTLSDSGAR